MEWLTDHLESFLDDDYLLIDCACGVGTRRPTACGCTVCGDGTAASASRVHLRFPASAGPGQIELYSHIPVMKHVVAGERRARCGGGTALARVQSSRWSAHDDVTT